MIDFSDALRVIRNGGVVTRQAWQGTGLTLGVMALPAESAIMPFLAVSRDGMLMAWTPSQQEMFANDWVQIQQEGIGHG